MSSVRYNYLLLFCVLASFLLLFPSSTLAATVTLSWGANTEPDLAGYKVYYGTSPRTGACPPGGYPLSVNAGNATTYTITGLTNSQTYYFSISAYDTTGNESCFSSEVSQTTPSSPDITPPTISGLTATSTSPTSATITWTTNEPATGYAEYGTTSSYGQAASSSALLTSQSLALSSLSPGTLYHYRVRSTDAAGLTSSFTSDATFTTRAQSTQFTIGDRVRVTASLNVRATPGTSGTFLGSQPQGAQGVVRGGPIFADGFWWWDINYDTGADGWSVGDFLELAPIVQDTTPPLRSNGSPSGVLSSGTATASLSLTTNESATCRYGTTASTTYVSLPTAFSTTGGIAHSSPVSNLSNGQSYSYYVRCQDAVGNQNTDDFAITFSVASPAAPSDPTPPTAMILFPSDGTTASGTVAVTASASDNIGVFGVQFLLDDANLGNEILVAPYTINWDTRSAVNGTHTLAARARDAAGNQTRSATTTVTVTNAVVCAENWTCTGWSACSSAGEQTRTCTDGNSCGTTVQRPSLTQSCTPPTSSPPSGSSGGGGGGVVGGGGGFIPQPPIAVVLTPSPGRGNAPLAVTLRADVSGTSVGEIAYTFYCNRADSGLGIQITPAPVARVGRESQKTWTTKETCTYPNQGFYTAKVIVESNGNLAEARAVISVSAPLGPVAGGRLMLILSQNLYIGMPRNPDVGRLQEFLKQLGYFPASQETTTFFGTVTMNAVQAYQRAYSIVSSGDPWSTGYGSVGPKTRNHMALGVILKGAITPSGTTRGLGQGISGEDVRLLQEKLKVLGFFPVSQAATGYFGMITEEAVKKFQCAKAIVCSGEPLTTGYGFVGPKTRAAL